MTAKEKAIKEAYGEYWEQVKAFVGANGFINSKLWLGDVGNTKIYSKLKGLSLDCLDNYDSSSCYYFRPKSLDGIEDNNGWTPIQSDDWLKSVEIDKSTTQYYVHDPNEDYISIIVRVEIDHEVEYLLLAEFLYITKERIYPEPIKATHYKPILNPAPKPPIY